MPTPTFKIIGYCLLILLIPGVIFSCSRNDEKDKPRIIVSTDIGGDDPDDFQSMVHLFMYADKFTIEGLISSPPGKGRVSDIDSVLAAYENDYSFLREASAQYPSPHSLRQLCKQGAIMPQEEMVPGPELSEGAKWIVRKAKEKDPRPLYILVWGSMTDVAQAVHSNPEIKKKVRIYSIGSWNTRQDPKARDYLFERHPDLWWIESNTTFRGMYMGGDQEGEWGNRSFVEKYVRYRGALGNFFYRKKVSIKMGDTPSVLYMLNGDPGDPEGESWGGSYRRNGHGKHYWTDDPDPSLRIEGKAGARTVSKWRVEYLSDWASRMGFLPKRDE